MERFTASRVAALAPVALLLYVLPLLVSRAMLPEATRLVALAGAAMSLNLLVGATGLISLGQGMFVGLGAYTVAISNIRFGVPYGRAALVALVLAIPLAFLTALVSLRARHLFFGLLTMAIGQVAFVWVARNYALTGGDDGLVGITTPGWLQGDLAHHLLAVTATVLASLALLKLLASPFGAMLRAVRDNPDRVASLGGVPKRFEIAAMVIAGLLATAFGVVLAGTDGTVDPGLFHWTTSANLLNMVALGGRSVFLGPILGAVVLEISRAYVQTHSSNADLVVGVLVIGCAVLFPEGLGPPLGRLADRAIPRRRAVTPAPSAPSLAGEDGGRP